MKTSISFLLTVLLILGAMPISGNTQEDESNALDYLPPSQFVTGWIANDNEYMSDALGASWLIGDDIELLLEFDLQWYATESYMHQQDEMVIEIFEFRSGSDAFGFYNLSYIDPPDPEAIEVTAPYSSPPVSHVETIRSVTYNGVESIEAYQDRFYFRITTDEEYLDLSGTQAALYILGRMPGFASRAGFLGALPLDDMVIGTERYIRGPVGLSRIMPTSRYDLFGNYEFDWTAGAAEYRAGSGQYYLLIAVEYEDSTTARSMVASVSDYYTDRGYEPLRLQPLDSGTVPYGYMNENYLAIWSENDFLWMIWDASGISVLNNAIANQ